MKTDLRESRASRAEAIFVALMLGCLVLGLDSVGWAQDAKPDRPAKAAAKDPVAKAPFAKDPVAKERPGKDNPGKPDGALRRAGRVFKVPLPITGRTTDELRQSVLATLERLRGEHVRPVLIFEFTVPKDQKEYGRGSKIGNAYDLADFISSKDLSDAETVAFVPRSIQGHAVLAVLACEDIIMARDAEIGPAGVDEPVITKAIIADYETIVQRHKKIPVEVALKLVDSSRELLEVQTEYGAEFTTPEGLAELSKKRAIPEDGRKVLFRAGEPAQFSGVEARNKGFIRAQASNRVELARALELPPESLEESSPLNGQWIAARVDIRGTIRADTIDKAERMIREAIERRGANFICVWIDSAGGSPADSMRLAGYLVERDPSRVRTVAYIPREARGDAAVIALACDQIVMHPGAVLGGDGEHSFTADEISDMTRMIRTQIAPKKSRCWSLPAAMFDSNLVVHEYRRAGEALYLSDDELAEQPKRDQWVKGEAVTTAGKTFQVRGDKAVQYLLASHEVRDLSGFQELYGLESNMGPLEPSWADTLIEAMASSGVAVMLLIIGGVALYAELSSPGIGVGGFVAAVCFVLFFWSRFLGGTAGWLEVALFLMGLVCLALEIFVIPGFGIFGLGGGLLMLASLVLASQTFVIPHNAYQAAEFRNSLLTIAGAAVGITAAIALLNRWLPHTPGLSQLILNPPSEGETAVGEVEPDLGMASMVGQRGAAITPLVPSGKARFGRTTLDVMSDGEFVSRGDEVEVVEVRGNRILVRRVQHP